MQHFLANLCRCLAQGKALTLVWLVIAVLSPRTGAYTWPSSRSPFHVRYQERTLANGLRVVLSPDRNTATFALCVAYGVGSRDDPAGQSGMAHLLEHMMFRGSEHVGPGEFAALVQLAGGFLNATTSTDRTNFYEALPKNQLALGLFLEADRMKSLRIDDQDFVREREVVLQERQFRIENRAYGRTDEAIQTLSYAGSSLPHATIGTKADLVRSTGAGSNFLS